MAVEVAVSMHSDSIQAKEWISFPLPDAVPPVYFIYCPASTIARYQDTDAHRIPFKGRKLLLSAVETF